MQPLTKGVVSGGKVRQYKRAAGRGFTMVIEERLEQRREQEKSNLGSGNMFDKQRRKRKWTYYSLDPCEVCDDEYNVIGGRRSGDNPATSRSDRRVSQERRQR